MSYLLKGATLIRLDPPAIESAELRIKGGVVTERAARLDPQPGEQVYDLSGKIVMPGLVCAHTHLYSALARGMPAPPRAPGNFKDILELIWWRLDRALDEETIYWSAIAGALEAARAGTTCLFDHHASPSHIKGSLEIVRRALERVGLRGVLCYEVSDRGGTAARDEGLDENRAFLERVGKQRAGSSLAAEHRLFGALVGAHASFTLSDESLDACGELMREYGAGLHIHAAEDLCDVEDARLKYGSTVVERLASHGLLGDRTILAHGTHLSEREIEIARNARVWLAHNPRSNMNNRVGYAPVVRFGERVALGTDGIGADMFEEARFAFFKGRDARQDLSASDWLRALANNQEMASAAFGFGLGELKAGAAADLVVMNYRSPTPLTAENLAWHFIFGFNSAQVESVMVDGKFVIEEGRSLLDEQQAFAEIRKAGEKLWRKLQSI